MQKTKRLVVLMLTVVMSIGVFQTETQATRGNSRQEVADRRENSVTEVKNIDVMDIAGKEYTNSVLTIIE